MDFTDAQLLNIAKNPETTDEDLKGLGDVQLTRLKTLISTGTKGAPPPSSGWWSPGAILAAGRALPAIASVAAEVGTNPNAAKAGGAIARGLTTAGAVAHGLYTGNPTEVLAAPMEGWAAGKGGYWLTKAGQTAARGVSNVAEEAAPAAQALGVAGAAFNAGAATEPNRPDASVIGPSIAVEGAHPPVVNEMIGKYVKLLPKWAQAQFLVDLGNAK